MNNIGTKRGKLIVVSGPSGAGKGTVLESLMKNHDEFIYSVSATTREPREGDVDGVNYFFMTREQFEKLISENGLLEYAQYNGNYYGTPRKFVEEKLSMGKNVILEIEVQGAFQIRKLYPDAVFFFITPESYEVLSKRLRSRGTEPEEVVRKRLEIAKREAPNALDYDFIIVNRDGKIDEAAEEIYSCVSLDGYKQSSNNRDVIETYFD